MCSIITELTIPKTIAFHKICFAGCVDLNEKNAIPQELFYNIRTFEHPLANHILTSFDNGKRQETVGKELFLSEVILGTEESVVP